MGKKQKTYRHSDFIEGYELFHKSMLQYTNEREKKYGRKYKRSILFNLNSLFIGTLWLILIISIGLLSMFIEFPFKMLTYSGSLKEKIKYWFVAWKHIYLGFIGK